jgi:hypothetical protein
MKSDLRDWFADFGCAGMVLILIVIFLLIIPLILALGGLVWGCVIYAVWNWVVVPVAAAPALTFFWQCFILGVAMTALIGAVKGVVMVNKD